MYIDEINSIERYIKAEEPQMSIISMDQAIVDLKIVEYKNE